MDTPEPTGADLDVLLRSKHPLRHSCKGCGSDDVMRTAITKLAYVFDVCNCDAADYEHLVESIWHRECLIGSEPFHAFSAVQDIADALEHIADGGYVKVTDRRAIERSLAAIRRAIELTADERDPRPCPYCIGAAFPCGASPDDPDHEPMTCAACEAVAANLAEPHAECLRSVAEYEEQRRRDHGIGV